WQAIQIGIEAIASRLRGHLLGPGAATGRVVQRDEVSEPAPACRPVPPPLRNAPAAPVTTPESGLPPRRGSKHGRTGRHSPRKAVRRPALTAGRAVQLLPCSRPEPSSFGRGSLAG